MRANSNLEIANNYLSWCRNVKRFSEDTISSYRNVLLQWSTHLKENGDIHFCQVVKSDIQLWQMSLHNRKMDNASVNSYISALKSFYNYLVNTKQIGKNPVAKITKAKVSKKLKDRLSVTELIRLIDKINDIGSFLFRDTVIFELFWNSGLRTMEFSSLKTRHLEKVEVLVDDKSRNPVNGKYSKKKVLVYLIKIVAGKGGKAREVTVGEATTYMIDKYLVGRNLKFPSTDYLFPNAHGKKINRRQVYGIIEGFLNLSHKTKKKGAHVLRHTYASMLLNNGVNILTVKELLGHSSAKTTTIYAKPDQDMLMTEFNKAHPKGDAKAKNTRDSLHVPQIINYIEEL